jgi:hypothetical protein
MYSMIITFLSQVILCLASLAMASPTFGLLVDGDSNGEPTQSDFSYHDIINAGFGAHGGVH